jgi:hypothetical protein
VRRVFFAVALTTALAGAAFSVDFGLVLNTLGEYTPDTDRQGFAFRVGVTPWFASALGGKANLYLSGKVTFEYGYDEEAWVWPSLVELERTELNFHPVQAVYLALGRQQFADIGKMIASGFFDGIYGNFGLGGARLSLGAFYTGFLYKETAEILMTAGDLEYYYRPFDYADLTSYFASRRVFASVTGEFPDLTSRTSLEVSALGQFDLNGYEKDPPLNSQYLEVRFGVEAVNTLRFFVTGIGGATETEWTDPKFDFAAALEVDWEIPGRLPDMFSAELRWGSGAITDKIGPFKPISSIAQGSVFAPALPGTMNARASYAARLHRTLSLSVLAVFFGRTDLETFWDEEMDGASQDRFLGWELYGQLIWAPQSALRFSAGGGAFFPGGAFVEGAGMRWKANAGVIVSL